MVGIGGLEFGKEGVTGAGKAGAGPDDVDNAGVQGAAMFARVVFVIPRRSGSNTVPRGTLLHKAQQAKVIWWGPFDRDVGDHLVYSK